MNRLTFLKLFAATPFAMAGVKSAAKPKPIFWAASKPEIMRRILQHHGWAFVNPNRDLAVACAALDAETRRMLQECIQLQRHTYRNIKSIGEALRD